MSINSLPVNGLIYQLKNKNQCHYVYCSFCMSQWYSLFRNGRATQCSPGHNDGSRHGQQSADSDRKQVMHNTAV